MARNVNDKWCYICFEYYRDKMSKYPDVIGNIKQLIMNRNSPNMYCAVTGDKIETCNIKTLD